MYSCCFTLFRILQIRLKPARTANCDFNFAVSPVVCQDFTIFCHDFLTPLCITATRRELKHKRVFTVFTSQFTHSWGPHYGTVLSICLCCWAYGHLGDKPTGRQTTGRHMLVIWATNQLGDRQLGETFWSSGRQTNWATDNWAKHFGQLGDNIGRVIKDVNVGKILEIISFWYIIVV